MTRKVGKTGKDGTTVPGGGNGYCEICRIHYDQLDAHVVSSQHTKLVSDPSQYLQLDSLISHHDLGNATSLRKSLRIAKSPPVEMGGKQSSEVPPPPPPPPPPPTPPTPLNGHITRSRTDKVLCNGLSPIEKKKKEIKLSVGSSGTSVQMEKVDVKEKEVVNEEKATDHNLRSRNSSSKPRTPQAKRIRQSRKRLSVEEKLIEDNKSYYKVEVLNSKLRSTEYFISQKQLEARVNGGEGTVNGCAEKPAEKEAKEPVVVRFKKVRKTQLAVLSDEAENFMFGDLTRKENESKADSTDSSEEDSGELRDDSDSSSEEEIPKRRKKRKSYSSERTDNGPSASASRHNDHQSSPTTSQPQPAEKKEEKSEEDQQSYTLKDITFGFELTPKKEPWMDSYVPVKKETNFYCPHYHEYPSFLMPYEYPPSERLKLLTASRSSSFGRRRDRFNRLLDDNKPRKSPRCHASTLAIMSSLMRRRPVRECTTNPDFTYEEESRSSLPETVESSSSVSDSRMISDPSLLPIDPSGDAYAIALARLACGETESFQLPPGPCLPIDPFIFDDPPPGIVCGPQPGLDLPLTYFLEKTPQNRLIDFDFRYNLDHDSGSECSDLIGFSEDGRGVSGRRRKRKRNMTGWPIEKPRKKVIKVKEEEESNNLLAKNSLPKCSPCAIKLEHIRPDLLTQLNIKQEPMSGDESAQTVNPIKRGRGRPRKYPFHLPPTNFPSPHLSPKSSPKKRSIPRFTFGPRKSCIK